VSGAGGGLPLRAVAMVLIAFAIVFGGLGAFSISGSGSSKSSAQTSTETTDTTTAPASTGAAASTAAPAPSAPATTAAPTTTAQAGVDKTVPVHVLNNSTVAGLASRTANQLRAAGWTNVTAGNYSASVLGSTTVYYGDSPREQAAAQAIARQLNATAAPRFAGLAGNGPGVVVIVTSG
jgi:hypothetical protein